jgi:hypothetical protein
MERSREAARLELLGWLPGRGSNVALKFRLFNIHEDMRAGSVVDADHEARKARKVLKNRFEMAPE